MASITDRIAAMSRFSDRTSIFPAGTFDLGPQRAASPLQVRHLDNVAKRERAIEYVEVTSLHPEPADLLVFSLDMAFSDSWRPMSGRLFDALLRVKQSDMDNLRKTALVKGFTKEIDDYLAKPEQQRWSSTYLAKSGLRFLARSALQDYEFTYFNPLLFRTADAKNPPMYDSAFSHLETARRVGNYHPDHISQQHSSTQVAIITENYADIQQGFSGPRLPLQLSIETPITFLDESIEESARHIADMANGTVTPEDINYVFNYAILLKERAARSEGAAHTFYKDEARRALAFAWEVMGDPAYKVVALTQERMHGIVGQVVRELDRIDPYSGTFPIPGSVVVEPIREKYQRKPLVVYTPGEPDKVIDALKEAVATGYYHQRTIPSLNEHLVLSIPNQREGLLLSYPLSSYIPSEYIAEWIDESGQYIAAMANGLDCTPRDAYYLANFATLLLADVKRQKESDRYAYLESAKEAFALAEKVLHVHGIENGTEQLREAIKQRSAEVILAQLDIEWYKR